MKSALSVKHLKVITTAHLTLEIKDFWGPSLRWRLCTGELTLIKAMVENRGYIAANPGCLCGQGFENIGLFVASKVCE